VLKRLFEGQEEKKQNKQIINFITWRSYKEMLPLTFAYKN